METRRKAITVYLSLSNFSYFKVKANSTFIVSYESIPTMLVTLVILVIIVTLITELIKWMKWPLIQLLNVSDT